MLTDPQDPKFPEPPGEPNSELEPGLPREEAAPSGEADVFPKEMDAPSAEQAPASGQESGDYISEIRQTLASEETGSKRSTGSLIKRITGSLRRVTGQLRNTDRLRKEKEEAELETPQPAVSEKLPTGRLESEPELSDELLTGRLGGEPAVDLPDEMLTGRLGSTTAPEPDELLTGRLGSTPAEEISDELLTGRLSNTRPPDSGDLLTGRLGSAPAQETPEDLLTGRLGETHATEIPDDLLTGRLGQAPETETSDGLLTGRLRALEEEERPDDLLTGRLGQVPEAEMPDDLLTGRLGQAPETEEPDDLLTGRLGKAPDTEMPDDLLTGQLPGESGRGIPENLVTRSLEPEPETEIPDDLLTGRLSQLEEEQIPGDLLTGRLSQIEEEEISDDLLTGRLGQAPETAAPDHLLTGRLEEEAEQTIPDRMVTRRLEAEPEPEISDDLLTGRLGGTTDLLTGRLDGLTEPETPAPGDLLTGRLGDYPVGEELPAVEEIPVDELWPSTPAETETGLPGSGSETAGLLEMGEETLPSAIDAPETALQDDEAITLLESGAIADLGMAEESKALDEEEPDWMKEIREEAAREAEQYTSPEAEQANFADADTWADEPPVEPQAPSKPTSQLRSFFTGIFGKPGGKGTQPEETEIPDALVTGRLERSLGVEAPETPLAQIGEDDIFAPADSTPGASMLDQALPAAFDEVQTVEETGALDIALPQETDGFFEGLEVSFSNVVLTDEENRAYEVYPEEETLLWDQTHPDQAETPPPDIPISIEDIWGKDTDENGYGSDLRREIWKDAAQPETPMQDFFRPSTMPEPDNEDSYAATYLTGTDFLPSISDEQEPKTPELLSTLLSDTPQTEEDASVEDLRAIALEDYEEGEFNYSDYTYKIDWGDEDQVIAAEVEGEDSEQVQLQQEVAEAETRRALSTDWKSWFVNRRTSDKLLVAEAVLVVLALIVAIPYFIFMIVRGPANAAPAAQPGAGDASGPYPTGLTLPGGWYFPLERSTLVNGAWQPSTSEWLEGSEVRRVVALPWNPQTEAVVKSFQVGDRVELYLSNNDTLKYRVYAIEQVAVNNTQVYSDQQPSLAIILYQGKDPNRWVIICKP